MYRSENVLVVVDFRQSEHHALPRAIELAKQFGSRLTVITCVYQKIVEFIPEHSNISRSQIEAEAKAHYEDKMRDLLSELSGVDVGNEHAANFEVVWNKNFQLGLTEYINKNSFDLIVKTAHSHAGLERLFFTPTDWHLLRDTETNILFVKNGVWPSNTTILGSINVETDDPEHLRLNKEIVSTAVELANSCSSTARILNVFPWSSANLERFKYLFENKSQFVAIKDAHAIEVGRFVEDYPQLKDEIIIAEGLDPQDTIPEIVKSTFCGLLIIGCVRRKGLAGWVIGNTVEKILDDISCEVLVLK